MDEHTAHRTPLFRALTAALITLALTLVAGPALASAEPGDGHASPTPQESTSSAPETYTPSATSDEDLTHLREDDGADLDPYPRSSPSPSTSPTEDCACDGSSMSGEAVWTTVVVIFVMTVLLIAFVSTANSDGSGGRGRPGGSPGGDGGGGGGGVADGGGGGC